MSAYLGKNKIAPATMPEKYDPDTKQDKLVSGTNIKTINGESILGAGDIVIENKNDDYVEGVAEVMKIVDDGSVNITTSLKVDASPKDPTDVIRLMDTATISDIDTLFNITTSGSGPVKATTITINNATVDKTVLALTKNNAAVQNSTLTIKP